MAQSFTFKIAAILPTALLLFAILVAVQTAPMNDHSMRRGDETTAPINNQLMTNGRSRRQTVCMDTSPAQVQRELTYTLRSRLFDLMNHTIHTIATIADVPHSNLNETQPEALITSFETTCSLYKKYSTLERYYPQNSTSSDPNPFALIRHFLAKNVEDSCRWLKENINTTNSQATPQFTCDASTLQAIESASSTLQTMCEYWKIMALRSKVSNFTSIVEQVYMMS